MADRSRRRADSARTDMPDGIGELPDGRLLLNVIRPGDAGAAHLRSRHGDLRLVHASRRPRRWICSPRRAKVRIASVSGCARTPTATSRLESFDGEKFTTHYDAGTRWHLVPPRSFLIASNGDVVVLPEQMGVGWLQRDGTYPRDRQSRRLSGRGTVLRHRDRARTLLVRRSRRHHRIQEQHLARRPLRHADRAIADPRPRRHDLGRGRHRPARASRRILGERERRRGPARRRRLRRAAGSQRRASGRPRRSASRASTPTPTWTRRRRCSIRS